MGSAGVIAAAMADSAPLLFLSLFVYGAGSATNLQARYAGADLADPRHRGRAVSTVLVATTLGGVVGPNLAAPTGAVAQALGCPCLAGPFLLAGAAYAAGALFLAVWLRPDPLLLAREIAASPQQPAGAGGEPGAVAPPRHGLPLGAGVMGTGPAGDGGDHDDDAGPHARPRAHHGGFGLGDLLHVAAMFLPSPLTGWLVDRVGRLWTACASGVVLLAAGALAAGAPPTSLPLLTAALVLLGLGWNLGLISGTALITDSVALATRARTQGTVDVAIAAAGAVGGMGVRVRRGGRRLSGARSGRRGAGPDTAPRGGPPSAGRAARRTDGAEAVRAAARRTGVNGRGAGRGRPGPPPVCRRPLPAPAFGGRVPPGGR